jgi:hypothetical protein
VKPLDRSALWLALPRWWQWPNLCVVMLCLLMFVTRADVLLTDRDVWLDVVLAPSLFDFAGWTAQATWSKLAQNASAVQQYLPEDEQQKLVLDYFDALQASQALNAAITRIYADATVTDPDAATTTLRQTLAVVRAALEAKQPLVEAILQEQTAQILDANQLTWLRLPVPPVAFQFTPLPQMLITSPRERIERLDFRNLAPDLPVATAAAYEKKIEQQLHVSAYITDIGGLGTYPTMVIETSNLHFVAEVAAHEWLHNYLSLRPLGFNFESSPEMRTMNETTASIAGRELGAQLLARFYPMLAAFQPSTPFRLKLARPFLPAAFDFNAAMHETRVQADALLAAGQIERAEAYMESRRQVFTKQGYALRRLNQAYFAFHGAYADSGGAAGSDPVGPAVVQIRKFSPSLKAFIETMAAFGSYEALQAAVQVLPAVP